MKNCSHTPEQQRIITTTAARVLVSAVAGSGKTRTLCARVRRLVDRGIPLSDILVLSFSNSAVDILTTNLPPGTLVQTFHAFALSLVKQAASQHGAVVPKLVSPARQVSLVASAVSACPKTCRSVCQKAGVALNTKKEKKRLLAFINRCNGSDAVAARLVQDAESGFACYANVLPELRIIRRAYNDCMKQAGEIDYPSMLRRAASAIGAVSPRFQHLLVDEAQDMNAAQTHLLARLADRIPNVMVFGDPRQAIYGFMGGTAGNLRNVLHDAVTLPLSRSFRLTKENAALANAILGGDHPVVGTGHGVTPLLTQCATAIAQEDAVVDLVRKLKSQGVAGDQIAILARTNAQTRLVEKALLAASFETHPVCRPHEPAHVDRLLDMLTFVQKCVATAKASKKPNRKWRAHQLVQIAGKTLSENAVADCLRALDKAIPVPSFHGHYTAAMRIYLRLMREPGKSVTNIEAELNRWQPIASKFETVQALRAHVEKLRAQAPIILSSIHRAKGDEWDHVIVLGLTDGSIPFYRDLKRGDTAEERRLFYVAVTRAREQVHLFHAPVHQAASRQVFTKPSSFVTQDVLATVRTPNRLKLPAMQPVN